MLTKLLPLLIILTLSGCLSFTSYEDGKTIGKGKTEVRPSLNIHKAPSITFFENEKELKDIPIIIYPNLAKSNKYGIGNKTDVYCEVGTNLSFSAGFKHQLIGDRNSTFALATGTEFEALAVLELFGSNESFIFNAQIPIYSSYHPSEKVSLYLTPRYVYQLKSATDVNDYHYYGGNFGILYGKKHKIGLDIGIFDVGVRDLGRLSIFNIGIGGKFVFKK